ncbi:MAG: GTPase Era [Clostridia bacterium]|nr:GTPase Era [Clostridia bacterium]
MENSFKAGFVTVIGRPNAGKSTLINKLIGEKVAITSPRPQTTRKNQLGILNGDNYQIVFIDTPGIHSPKNKLGEYMVKSANDAMTATDVIIFLYDATENEVSQANEELLARVAAVDAKKLLVITKIDLVEKEKLLTIIGRISGNYNFDSIIPVSALKNDGLDIVVNELLEMIPESPPFYDEDIYTVSTVRDIAAEIIREKILYFTNEEVPHGTGVEIIAFSEPRNKKLAVTIEANVYCEKASHKGILIGKDGAMLRRIGSSARSDIEKLCGRKVNLKLWVKVSDDWRNKGRMLRELGYKDEQ